MIVRFLRCKREKPREVMWGWVSEGVCLAGKRRQQRLCVGLRGEGKRETRVVAWRFCEDFSFGGVLKCRVESWCCSGHDRARVWMIDLI